MARPAAIASERPESDLLRLVFVEEEKLRAAKLKEVLAEHLRGFREAFARSR